jgi:predicted transcriptional regulator
MNSYEIDTSPKRRDKLRIIAQILETAKEPTLKTQIMYRANLSFEQLNEYLEFMTNLDLLEKFAVRRKELYRATRKGAEFATRYTEITQLLRMEESKGGIRVPPENLLNKKSHVS